MLIFLSELLKENKSITAQFAALFNDVCKSVHKSILGSLSIVNESTYGLIMTNPPCVTKGSRTQKKAISEIGKLKQFYKYGGVGVESLFIQKIVGELKPNRDAFIIVPDGLFEREADDKIRKMVLDKCIVNAIVSLPVGALYSSSKKTFILSITKKDDPSLALRPAQG